MSSLLNCHLSAVLFLGTCLLNYTLHTALTTCVHKDHKYLCIWLFSKQNISWDGINCIPLQVIFQRISILHTKERGNEFRSSPSNMEPNHYGKPLLSNFSIVHKVNFSNCSQFTLIIFMAYSGAFKFCLGSEF